MEESKATKFNRYRVRESFFVDREIHMKRSGYSLKDKVYLFDLVPPFINKNILDSSIMLRRSEMKLSHN